MIRDLLAFVIVAGGFYMLRHTLFGREPQGHETAPRDVVITQALGAGSRAAAPSRPSDTEDAA